MLKNYFSVAFRNLVNNRIFSIINILGLALGIAACLFISLYVNYENSYDMHVENIDRLYRITYERISETGEKVQFASASPSIGPAIKEKFPEVINYARIYRLEGVISNNIKYFKEENMFWAEPAFLELFSYKIISKNTSKLLDSPNTMIISDKMACKYFGDENPLGKTLKLDGKVEFRITGIFKSQPENMHFKADALLSYINWENQLGENVKTFGWVYSGFYTYIQLKDKVLPSSMNNKIKEYIQHELGDFMDKYKIKIAYHLQAVKDIHLNSHYMHELKSNGNKDSIILLKIIAWFIILIAWINFINLLTIKSIKRIKEISLRKVIGSSNKQLIRQFLVESLLINTIALIIAFVIIESGFLFFSQLTGIPPSYFIWNKTWFWQNTIIIFLIGTILAGSYPVWGIISKNIALTIKAQFKGSRHAVTLRKILLIFQFFIATILIAGTFCIYKQLNYLKSKETGINISNILVINTPRVGNKNILSQRMSFKEEVSKFSFIKNIAYSSVIPGKHNIFNRGGIRRVSDENFAGENYRITEIDQNFFDVYSNKLIAGQKLSGNHNQDIHKVIVNLEASKLLGFKNPKEAIGEEIFIRNEKNMIVGVTENFYQESPRLDFEPQIFRPALIFNGYFSVKLINSMYTKKILKKIKNTYKDFFPGNPFDYFFLENFIMKQYKSEHEFGKVFSIFSILALIITILGILSLSSFSAAQRKKEIGIRKVLGANTKQILILLSKSYIAMLIISFLLAIPVTYYSLNKWLVNFANKVELSVWIFLIPITIVFTFSLITVIYQSLEAAKENPVNSLRYE